MAAYMFHLAGINMLNHDREYFLACFGAKKDILERMVARDGNLQITLAICTLK